MNKNFIDQLQELDEPMKRRILIVTTALAMVVVVYVWVGYFNSIIPNNPVQLADQSAAAQQPAAQEAAPAANPPAATPGFWQMLGGGFTSLYHGFVSNFAGLGNSRQYDITPEASSSQ